MSDPGRDQLDDLQNMLRRVEMEQARTMGLPVDPDSPTIIFDTLFPLDVTHKVQALTGLNFNKESRDIIRITHKYCRPQTYEHVLTRISCIIIDTVCEKREYAPKLLAKLCKRFWDSEKVIMSSAESSDTDSAPPRTLGVPFREEMLQACQKKINGMLKTTPPNNTNDIAARERDVYLVRFLGELSMTDEFIRIEDIKACALELLNQSGKRAALRDLELRALMQVVGPTFAKENEHEEWLNDFLAKVQKMIDWGEQDDSIRCTLEIILRDYAKRWAY
ncbi:MAG: hypothetical protein M1812_005479 [Candelaria pacifica]|nr:MAG: hypothetical protein M1812_005479 [Candelaria pacifica]